MTPAQLGLGLFLVAHTMLFAALASAWLFLLQSDPTFHGFTAMLGEAAPIARTLYWPTTASALGTGVVALLAARAVRNKGITLLAGALGLHACLVAFMTVSALIQVGAPATANLIALFTVVDGLWAAHAAVAVIGLAVSLRGPAPSIALALYTAYTALGWTLFRIGFAST